MKATKKEIGAALEELEGIYGKRDAIQKKFDKAIAPAEQEYLEKIKPFQDERDGKIKPLLERAAEIEKEIQEAVLSQKDESGDPKLRLVEGSEYKAEALCSTDREIDAEEFFKIARPKTGFWDCLKVLVGKAEKLLSADELQKVSSVKKSWRVVIGRK